MKWRSEYRRYVEIEIYNKQKNDTFILQKPQTNTI